MFFHDGEEVECDIALTTLHEMWQAVTRGYMEARVYFTYRQRRMLFDIRFLDPHRTFLSLRRGAA